LRGVSFSVDAGEIVSIYGRNGAGKTTALRAIMGWLRPTEGQILFQGEAIGGLSPDRVFRRGVAFIPEDRRIFATLTVEENLTLALFTRWQSAAQQKRELARVFDLFPRLRERRSQPGRTLSGGERDFRCACAHARCGHRAPPCRAECPPLGGHQQFLLRDGERPHYQSRRARRRACGRGHPTAALRLTLTMVMRAGGAWDGPA